MTKTTKIKKADVDAKDELSQLIQAIGEKLASGELSAPSPAQLEKMQELADINNQHQEELKKFTKGGFKYGTINESWDALRGIAQALKHNKYPIAEHRGWLVSAVERCKEDDEMQLLRELGLIVRGRRRTVNPDAVSGRVAELVKSGSSIMAACKQASDELGCTTKTAHRWYKQGQGAEFDGRKK